MRKTMKNVDEVYSKVLCMGCGICAGMCPNDAISIIKDKKEEIYIPKVDKKKCTGCGLCLKVCPGISVDFKSLNLSIFGKEAENKLIGNYLQCYTGHTTNRKLRYDCSSGGVVTQMLLFLLENKIINGALVTRIKENNPLEPESFIARTKEEIISAKGSKYCPVSIDIALKGIHNSKKEEKFAVVGLPCHIHGIRKAEEYFPDLKRKIILHIGIFCSHAPNFKAAKNFINKKIKVRSQDIQKLSYRGYGWPGYMEILQKEGKKIKVSLSNYWRFLGLDIFTSSRCRLCIDETAELADVSCGDAWLPEFSKDKIGTSILIVRTPEAKNFLNSISKIKRLSLEETNTSKVIQSQHSVLDYKKIVVPCKIKIRKMFGKNSPNYNIDFFEPGIKSIFRAVRNRIISLAYGLYIIYFK